MIIVPVMQSKAKVEREFLTLEDWCFLVYVTPSETARLCGAKRTSATTNFAKVSCPKCQQARAETTLTYVQGIPYLAPITLNVNLAT